MGSCGPCQPSRKSKSGLSIGWPKSDAGSLQTARLKHEEHSNEIDTYLVRWNCQITWRKATKAFCSSHGWISLQSISCSSLQLEAIWHVEKQNRFKLSTFAFRVKGLAARGLHKQAGMQITGCSADLKSCTSQWAYLKSQPQVVWAALHMFVHCEGGIFFLKKRVGAINYLTAVHTMVAKCTTNSAHLRLLLSTVQEQQQKHAVICSCDVQQTQTRVPSDDQILKCIVVT